MLVGKVLRFDQGRGFGWIRPAPEQGPVSDHFFHVSDYRGDLPGPHEEVAYDLAKRGGKVIAVDIRPRHMTTVPPRRQREVDDGGLLKTLNRGST
jgi:cold shock CspA family protein